jgi:hypothetical protein
MEEHGTIVPNAGITVVGYAPTMTQPIVNLPKTIVVPTNVINNLIATTIARTTENIHPHHAADLLMVAVTMIPPRYQIYMQLAFAIDGKTGPGLDHFCHLVTHHPHLTNVVSNFAHQHPNNQ